MAMDPAVNLKLVEEEWDAALPSLQDFVRIPNLTVSVDSTWETNGLLDRATEHVAAWVRDQKVAGCQVEVLKDPGFSPFLYVEIPGTSGSPKASNTFVMYGHLDKQPHGEGWDADISPTCGTIRDGKLYGRGAGDDGYAVYSSVIAVKVLQRQGIDHPRVVILAETSEESGSPHLAHYVEKLIGRIGEPNAVYCLDSGAEDFNTLWVTTSLRGVVMGSLEVSLIKDGFHSGIGSGIIPDAFRIVRRLLARVEDTETGQILLPELHTKIPVDRQEQMKTLAEEVGRPDVSRAFPWQPGAGPQHSDDVFRMYVDNCWEPTMTVVGFDGLPVPAKAGNVLHPSVKLQISFRIPPLVDHVQAAKAIKEAFERDPPCGARVVAKFGGGHEAAGWNAADPKPQLQEALDKSCSTYFGKPVGYMGLGGTIPLMEMLSKMFPDASLLVTGILGPGTGMHGPNEFLPIDYTKKVTAAVAMVMGVLQPEKPENWPEGVPLPDAGDARPKKRKRTFCFTQPNVPIGQCLCCL